MGKKSLQTERSPLVGGKRVGLVVDRVVDQLESTFGHHVEIVIFVPEELLDASDESSVMLKHYKDLNLIVEVNFWVVASFDLIFGLSDFSQF